MITLQQWLDKSNTIALKTESGGTYVLSDLVENPYHLELWNLSDYRVTTAHGITIYLKQK